jgi:hypothetical protein
MKVTFFYLVTSTPSILEIGKHSRNEEEAKGKRRDEVI